MTWTVNWSSYSLSALNSYVCTADFQYCPGNFSLQAVSRVDLPPNITNGTQLSYLFDYSDANELGWGELNSVVLPAAVGAQATQATYSFAQEGHQKQSYDLLDNPVSTKTLTWGYKQDGTVTARTEGWQYAFTPVNSTITGPDGQAGGIKHYFYDRGVGSDPKRGLVYRVEKPHGVISEH